MDLESTLVSLLRLRQRARSNDLSEEEAGRLADLEQEVSRYSGMAVLNAITRPGVPGTVWPLVR